MKVYLIEIIRYGNPVLGVQTFTITDNFDKIESKMIRYNQNRGGKYPSYYVTEFNLNEFNLQQKPRTRYDIRINSEGVWVAHETFKDQLK